MKKKRILILGGGISGLAAAHRLLELAGETFEMTLLEASKRLGGVIETELREGFLMEAGPDAFISEKPWALELARRLGLESEIIGTRDEFRRSFVYQDGELTPVPNGFYLIAPNHFKTLFQSKLLSSAGKLRMACEMFIPRRRDGKEESVAHFVRRRFGPEALVKIGQPMIGGIYMADPERLSLDATLPRLLEMERRHGSVIRALRAEDRNEDREAAGPRYSLFLSLRGGMEKLVSTLVQKMPGIRLRPGAEAVGLEPGNPWKVRLRSGKILEAEAVCIALSAPRVSHLVQSFSQKLSEDLAGIPYESVATVNLAFRQSDVGRPLDGFGFVVPAAQKRVVAACTFSSVKYAGRSPEGSVLLRAFVGGALQREMFALDDREMEKRVIEEISRALKISKAPLLTSLHRYPESMPQYHLGHQARVGTIENRLKGHPGLFLTGNAYRGVGIPDCIHHAEETASEMVSFMKGGARDEI